MNESDYEGDESNDHAGGGHVGIAFGLQYFKFVYRDEYTNEVLLEDLVQNAIREELINFNGKALEITDSEGARKLKDAKIVKCRWVICSKGDSINPDVRARLVEVNANGTKAE